METPTDSLSTTSLKSNPKKQVGFTRTRPTLIIPPPEPNHIVFTPRTAPTLANARKQSVFFAPVNGIRDFTKSGLGIGEKCAYCVYNKLRAWSRKWFTHMFLTIVLVLYTIGGALVFEFIEGQSENAVKLDLETSKLKLLKEIRQSSLQAPIERSLAEWVGEASRGIQQYEHKLINYYSTHKLALGNKKTWTFWNAFVFCGNIYTSIGYGHIYPETKTGKALTIVYAIIGIPLFLLALTDFGKLFTRCIKFLWSFVRRLYYTGSCRKVRKTAHVQDIFKGAQLVYEIATFRRPSMFNDAEAPEPEAPTTPALETPATPALSNFEIDDEFNLPISLAIFILIVYILLGGLIYCLWEGWNFFDSFYFVFISMSTIGFGDIVPDDAACMIVSIVYLVFGLALMSMCINVVQDKLSDTFKTASTKIGHTIGIAVSDDDGSITTVPPSHVEIPQVHAQQENPEAET